MLADLSDLSDLRDKFSVWLTKEKGVAVVPGSSFYSSPNSGGNLIRFAFCKTVDPLEGVDRLMSTRSG